MRETNFFVSVPMFKSRSFATLRMTVWESGPCGSQVSEARSGAPGTATGVSYQRVRARLESCRKGCKQWRALAPAMSKPSRPSDPNSAAGSPRTFFTTTRTAGGKALFQTKRMADLFIDVLRSYMRTGKIIVHDFVVMPNHVHILMTVPGEISLEKAMQLIKGGFSFRAKKELGFRGEIWQRGFSDVRIVDEQSFQQHRAYIHNNPVKAGLASSPEEYPSGSAYLKMRKSAGAK
jgi:putative transposase